MSPAIADADGVLRKKSRGSFIMYGDTVAIFCTNGFYLSATGGVSARPADAVALRITQISPWRMGQPLLKGDNFLLLNGSLVLRAGAGACVVVDWWTGDELMRFFPMHL
eukprot:m51a1_g6066 hypothetical protein (109) ;mRNA; r:262320-264633